jgi:hypothetical protein
MKWVIKKGDRYLRFVSIGEQLQGPYRIEESWDDPRWGVAWVPRQGHGATFLGRPDDVVRRLWRQAGIRCVRVRDKP